MALGTSRKPACPGRWAKAGSRVCQATQAKAALPLLFWQQPSLACHARGSAWAPWMAFAVRRNAALPRPAHPPPVHRRLKPDARRLQTALAPQPPPSRKGQVCTGLMRVARALNGRSALGLSGHCAPRAPGGNQAAGVLTHADQARACHSATAWRCGHGAGWIWLPAATRAAQQRPLGRSQMASMRSAGRQAAQPVAPCPRPPKRACGTHWPQGAARRSPPSQARPHPSRHSTGRTWAAWRCHAWRRQACPCGPCMPLGRHGKKQAVRRSLFRVCYF